MLRFFKRLWRAAPVATALFVVAVLAAAVFSVRMVQDHPWRDWSPDQPVEAWMTPGFIGHAYHIEKAEVIAALKAPMPPPAGPMTLAELAALRGVPLEQVMDEARALVAKARAAND